MSLSIFLLPQQITQIAISLPLGKLLIGCASSHSKPKNWYQSEAQSRRINILLRRSGELDQFTINRHSMAQSIDKPPFFDGSNYSQWKIRMKYFINSRDYKIWDIVEDGQFMPKGTKAEWSVEDRKKMVLNHKALHILVCAFHPSIY